MANRDYEIIKRSHLFDENWYSKEYLEGKPSDSIKHYIDVGCEKNYNPTPHFNTAWYLEKNPDVKKSGMNPFVHYIMHGRKEGRAPNQSFDIKKLDDYRVIQYSGLFDEEWFSKYYSLNWSKVDLVRYYINDYLNYGLNPSTDFDSIWYLERYDDVKRSGMNPFAHYIKYGKNEGRKPKRD